MEKTQPPKHEPVSVVISKIVKSNRIHDYEAWIKEINYEVKQFDGFLGVDVIRPTDHDKPEYVAILRFDTYDHLKQMQESPIIVALVEKSRDMVLGKSHEQKASGMELWFTLPDKNALMPKPARYKMVIISSVIIYVLILAINITLGPLINKLPAYLGFPISIVVMSWLLTYPIMPLVTRLFDFWLYPSPASEK